MRIQLHRGWRIEPEARRIQAVAGSVEIISRVLRGCRCQHRNGSRIHAGKKDRIQLRSRQGSDSLRAIPVAQLTTSQIRKWNRARHSGLAGITASFVAIEKEEFVFDDWTTDGSAKGVTNQLGPRHYWSRKVVEPVVGRQCGSAIRFKKRAMPSVGAAF